MYNPWNMNGGYYPPQQQMQPPPQPQWMASAQAQIPKAQAAANQQARLQERIGTLQEQYKGAGTEQQAGMQQRIDEMQAKLKAQQGTATGAQRENYGWRQERRQAKNAMAAGNDPTMAPQQKQPNAVRGGAQPEPAMMMGGGFGGQMNGMAQYFGQLPPGFGQSPQGGYGVGSMGMGGGMPQYGGMNYGGGMQSWMQQPMMYGGYNQSMGGNQTGLAEQGQMPPGAQRPGMQYRQDRRQARRGGNEMAQAGQPQGGAPSWYEAGSFDTPFGNLVQSSVGNGNIYKQNGSDGQSLYHYDPNVGWKHMTQQEYMGYNNPADFYQDPNQYAAAAGGNKSQMQMKNGMYQTMLGTGTYR